MKEISRRLKNTLRIFVCVLCLAVLAVSGSVLKSGLDGVSAIDYEEAESGVVRTSASTSDTIGLDQMIPSGGVVAKHEEGYYRPASGSTDLSGSTWFGTSGARSNLSNLSGVYKLIDSDGVDDNVINIDVDSRNTAILLTNADGANMFSGTIYGEGRTIRFYSSNAVKLNDDGTVITGGVYTNTPSGTGNRVGLLFSGINAAKIYDLNIIVDAYLLPCYSGDAARDFSMGVIAGQSTGDILLDNVHVTINSAFGIYLNNPSNANASHDVEVGGLFGRNGAGTIKNSSVTVNGYLYGRGAAWSGVGGGVLNTGHSDVAGFIAISYAATAGTTTLTNNKLSGNGIIYADNANIENGAWGENICNIASGIIAASDDNANIYSDGLIFDFKGRIITKVATIERGNSTNTQPYYAKGKQATFIWGRKASTRGGSGVVQFNNTYTTHSNPGSYPLIIHMVSDANSTPKWKNAATPQTAAGGPFVFGWSAMWDQTLQVSYASAATGSGAETSLACDASVVVKSDVTGFLGIQNIGIVMGGYSVQSNGTTGETYTFNGVTASVTMAAAQQWQRDNQLGHAAGASRGSQWLVQTYMTSSGTDQDADSGALNLYPTYTTYGGNQTGIWNGKMTGALGGASSILIETVAVGAIGRNLSLIEFPTSGGLNTYAPGWDDNSAATSGFNQDINPDYLASFGTVDTKILPIAASTASASSYLLNTIKAYYMQEYRVRLGAENDGFVYDGSTYVKLYAQFESVRNNSLFGQFQTVTLRRGKYGGGLDTETITYGFAYSASGYVAGTKNLETSVNADIYQADLYAKSSKKTDAEKLTPGSAYLLQTEFTGSTVGGTQVMRAMSFFVYDGETAVGQIVKADATAPAELTFTYGQALYGEGGLTSLFKNSGYSNLAVPGELSWPSSLARIPGVTASRSYEATFTIDPSVSDNFNNSVYSQTIRLIVLPRTITMSAKTLPIELDKTYDNSVTVKNGGYTSVTLANIDTYLNYSTNFASIDSLYNIFEIVSWVYTDREVSVINSVALTIRVINGGSDTTTSNYRILGAEAQNQNVATAVFNYKGTITQASLTSLESKTIMYGSNVTSTKFTAECAGVESGIIGNYNWEAFSLGAGHTLRYPYPSVADSGTYSGVTFTPISKNYKPYTSSFELTVTRAPIGYTQQYNAAIYNISKTYDGTAAVLGDVRLDIAKYITFTGLFDYAGDKPEDIVSIRGFEYTSPYAGEHKIATLQFEITNPNYALQAGFADEYGICTARYDGTISPSVISDLSIGLSETYGYFANTYASLTALIEALIDARLEAYADLKGLAEVVKVQLRDKLSFTITPTYDASHIGAEDYLDAGVYTINLINYGANADGTAAANILLSGLSKNAGTLTITRYEVKQENVDLKNSGLVYDGDSREAEIEFWVNGVEIDVTSYAVAYRLATASGYTSSVPTNAGVYKVRITILMDKNFTSPSGGLEVDYAITQLTVSGVSIHPDIVEEYFTQYGVVKEQILTELYGFLIGNGYSALLSDEICKNAVIKSGASLTVYAVTDIPNAGSYNIVVDLNTNNIRFDSEKAFGNAFTITKYIVKTELNEFIVRNHNRDYDGTNAAAAIGVAKGGDLESISAVTAIDLDLFYRDEYGTVYTTDAPTNAGSYVVRIAVKTNDNFDASEIIELPYVIQKRTLTIIADSLTVTYDGSPFAIVPRFLNAVLGEEIIPIITYSITEVIDGTSVTEEYIKPTNAGYYRVIISLDDSMINYTAATVEYGLRINKVIIEFTVVRESGKLIIYSNWTDAEYSIDGKIWQSSNVFEVSDYEEYLVRIRFASVETNYEIANSRIISPASQNLFLIIAVAAGSVVFVGAGVFLIIFFKKRSARAA